ncbi:hypothetical protein [Stratiformator vulcanicus]|uniref:Uncharacterized protein n=1 Tax=Stratiformator vulcanicus TaxID=2527980 RepID=A0A517QVQ0_9PLAN|nr:hypothetical protein [Stratiformator vulcanicus]QDT35654.1 hypothetical protein Pan189_00070 [Stratiformator vulcanicus]
MIRLPIIVLAGALIGALVCWGVDHSLHVRMNEVGVPSFYQMSIDLFGPAGSIGLFGVVPIVMSSAFGAVIALVETRLLKRWARIFRRICYCTFGEYAFLYSAGMNLAFATYLLSYELPLAAMVSIVGTSGSLVGFATYRWLSGRLTAGDLPKKLIDRDNDLADV